MRILHYALGFPPYRSGGLTKFCMDLMIQQAKEGYAVAMAWPGQMGFIDKRTSVKKRSDVHIGELSVGSYEIINPLPISYDEGIADIDAFTADTGVAPYEQLIREFNPDVIHVHTLMGLHKSLLQAAKDANVRLIFTAHDFFPICPKVTMFRNGTICKNALDCRDCSVCNTTALSLRKIQILQSPIYRTLKDSAIVKRLRKHHRDAYLDNSIPTESSATVNSPDAYMRLRRYYGSLLQLMDIVHYNSSVTKDVYETFYNISNCCVVNITHADIHDHRKLRNYSHDMLHIRYLGNIGGAKGFFLLKAALDRLWDERQDFCLDIHFVPIEMSPYIRTHGRYTYNDLETIFDDTDILVAPSVWYETFGYTVLEALSYGVPVIISGTVGAGDVLAEGAGIIIEDISPERLCDAIARLTPDDLREMNAAIVEHQSIAELGDMARQIEQSCYEW